MQAISVGALDVVCKPEYDSVEAKELIQKLRILAGVSVITRIKPNRLEIKGRPLSDSVVTTAPSINVVAEPLNFKKLVVIAASTGGPQALAQILPHLPADFPSPILIGQHIAYGFAQGMADWLNQLCQLPVKLAQNNQAICPGVIYIAPSETDMMVNRMRNIVLSPSKAQSVYHPNCDELLSSSVRVFGKQVVGVIVSGMGHDGVAGIASVNLSGGITIAQDEASSVVYGMNKLAIEQNHIQQILPANAIADAIINAVMTVNGVG